MFIEITNLKKGYGNTGNYMQVLNDISVSLEKGKICAIMGPSGSGKSTLLNIIGGIDRADSGKVLIDGKDIATMNPKELSIYRRNYLGFVFQFYNLVPNLTLEENILTGGELSDSPLELDTLLKDLGLEMHRKKFPSQLSGGQQQRCSIARALMKKPEILLCDEPTGALDYKSSKEILEVIERVNQKYSTTIIIVTHNAAIEQMAHRVIHIKDGKIEVDFENKDLVAAKDLNW